MWKGAIQFGLVTIPVKLYLATESSYQVRFNMLHEKDLSRIQMKTWCPVDEAVISRSETVKGYEYAPDQYVVITDEDLEKVPLKTVRSIEIEQFTKVDPEDSNTRFVKQAYYLEPDKIGRKAFYLLKSVLADEGLTAICKVVIKDYKPAELAMARQLVSAMTGEFDADAYHDEYRDALMKVIEAKVEGHAPAAPAPVEETGKLVDLMAALEASVKASKAARDAEKPVSVSEAKKAREDRVADAADGTHRKPAARAKKAARDDGADEAETATAAKPRRRKSA